MTTAQIIESEQGTEFIAAIDDFVALATAYEAGLHSVGELHVFVDKVVRRLNELGMDMPVGVTLPE